MNKADIEQHRKRRNQAFEEDDFDWVKEQLPDAATYADARRAFHKARYHCTDVSKKKRMESQSYLIDNNLTDAVGAKVNVGDDLPW